MLLPWSRKSFLFHRISAADAFGVRSSCSQRSWYFAANELARRFRRVHHRFNQVALLRTWITDVHVWWRATSRTNLTPYGAVRPAVVYDLIELFTTFSALIYLRIDLFVFSEPTGIFQLMPTRLHQWYRETMEIKMRTNLKHMAFRAVGTCTSSQWHWIFSRNARVNDISNYL